MREIEPGVLAEQIARLMRAEKQKDDLGLLIASIEKINARLNRIEGILLPHGNPADASLKHPSLDRFALPDEAANTSSATKTCGYEPHNRPCDHCSMCGSRGF